MRSPPARADAARRGAVGSRSTARGRSARLVSWTALAALVRGGLGSDVIAARKISNLEGGLSAFYTLDDLNIGAEITIYGRTFHIIDCNKSTRDYLASIGKDVGPSVGWPSDKYEEDRATGKPLVAQQFGFYPGRVKANNGGGRKGLCYHVVFNDGTEVEQVPQYRIRIVGGRSFLGSGADMSVGAGRRLQEFPGARRGNT